MENLKILFRERDPNKLGLLRATSKLYNPDGDGRILFVTDPDVVSKIFQAEGPYPYRGGAFDVLKCWRNSRPNLFPDTIGVVLEEGEEWQQIRSLVQQDMMRVKSAMFYIDELQKVGADFCDYLQTNVLDENGVTPDNFLQTLYDYGLEGISVVAVDTRIGCFDPKMQDPELKKFMEDIRVGVDVVGEMVLAPPFWKLAPRFDPKYQLMAKSLDAASAFVMGKIEEAKERINAKQVEETKPGHVHVHDEHHEVSILEKLILKCGPKSTVPFVMSFDMMVAGIDTTGSTGGFMLYHLSKNPKVQEKVRQEILANSDPKTGHITESGLNRMRLMKACLKETHRLTPVIGINSRRSKEDVEMKGYLIPKNTDMFGVHMLSARDPDVFPDPDSFKPQRWLRDADKHSKVHPFASLPFGHGKRMCIGKRFAELELYLMICKVLQRYRLEWVGDPDLGVSFRFINAPDKPLKIKFTSLK